MNPFVQQAIRQALRVQAERCRGRSPIYTALCEGLGAGPSPALTAIFEGVFRILTVANPDAELLLSGLHYLALRGDAARVAQYFPSCGGRFHPGETDALLAAAEADLEAHQEELLDFLLTYQVQRHDVQASAAFLLGAMAVVERFGGGLSLVEIGAAGGLNLCFDHYAYQFGQLALGDSPLRLRVDLHEGTGAVARLLAQGVPPVVARYGLDLEPRDLLAPTDRLLLQAFIWPDDDEAHARYRTATDLLPDLGPVAVQQGAAEEALPTLLVDAYNAMAPGNTLLLCHSLLWPSLSDEQRRRIATAVQRLAAQLQPHKPLAWLQLEPFATGDGRPELRLHTFGWADQEDRTVERLASVTPDLSSIWWLT